MVHLHHMSSNDGIMCSYCVPKLMFCELAYTDKSHVGVETLSQLRDVPIVELEGHIAHAHAHTAVENSTIGQCSAQSF